jgi:hypothetical protein
MKTITDDEAEEAYSKLNKVKLKISVEALMFLIVFKYKRKNKVELFFFLQKMVLLWLMGGCITFLIMTEVMSLDIACSQLSASLMTKIFGSGVGVISFLQSWYIEMLKKFYFLIKIIYLTFWGYGLIVHLHYLRIYSAAWAGKSEEMDSFIQKKLKQFVRRNQLLLEVEEKKQQKKDSENNFKNNSENSGNFQSNFRSNFESRHELLELESDNELLVGSQRFFLFVYTDFFVCIDFFFFFFFWYCGFLFRIIVF